MSHLFYIQILEQIGINIILAVGLNLIVGFSGQFSLGMPDLWRLVPILQPFSVLNHQPMGAFFGAMVLGALIAGVGCLDRWGSKPFV